MGEWRIVKARKSDTDRHLQIDEAQSKIPNHCRVARHHEMSWTAREWRDGAAPATASFSFPIIGSRDAIALPIFVLFLVHDRGQDSSTQELYILPRSCPCKYISNNWCIVIYSSGATQNSKTIHLYRHGYVYVIRPPRCAPIRNVLQSCAEDLIN